MQWAQALNTAIKVEGRQSIFICTVDVLGRRRTMKMWRSHKGMESPWIPVIRSSLWYEPKTYCARSWTVPVRYLVSSDLQYSNKISFIVYYIIISNEVGTIPKNLARQGLGLPKCFMSMLLNLNKYMNIINGLFWQTSKVGEKQKSTC